MNKIFHVDEVGVCILGLKCYSLHTEPTMQLIQKDKKIVSLFLHVLFHLE